MKHNRLLSFFLAFLLLALLPSPALAAEAEEPEETEAPWIELGSLEALEELRKNPEGRFRLTADIDMSGQDWVPVPFYGELDGAGHTLFNLHVAQIGWEARFTYDGNLKKYDTAFAGFFSVLENAKVYDLDLTAPLLEIQASDPCFVGCLAGYMDHAEIDRCTVQFGRASLTNYAVMGGVGGLVGYGCGDIRNCRVETELVYIDQYTLGRCEEFMGGILSCGIANITDNTVNIEGYDSCNGYVHNGGIVGMYYYCLFSFRGLSVKDNHIDGFISFFENNPNRRAYCSIDLGEALSMPGNYRNNTGDFERRETFEYSRILLPESCEEPELEDIVTPPECIAWGFTDHRCTVCGHAWRDSFTPPAHRPGEWETVREATAQQPGLRVQRCSICLTELAEESIAYSKPQEPKVLNSSLSMHYKDVTVLPGAGGNVPVTWTSSDESVVSVDEHGTVTALARGNAVLRCESADGLYTETCAVTVDYSLGQWLIVILLFGWLWY